MVTRAMSGLVKALFERCPSQPVSCGRNALPQTTRIFQCANNSNIQTIQATSIFLCANRTKEAWDVPLHSVTSVAPGPRVVNPTLHFLQVGVGSALLPPVL